MASPEMSHSAAGDVLSEVDPQYSDATLRYYNRKNEREDVQKKTFTKWINSQLSKAGRSTIEELFTDLKDGTQLLALLEVLSGQNMKPEKGRMRVHHLNNVNRALQMLEQECNIKLVNINNNDIVDGNPKLTLGLVWNIILHWQVKDILKDVMADLQQTNLEKTLLSWCRQNTQGYKNIDIRNFTSSWRDGLAFNALIHKFHPHLFTYEDLLQKDSDSNLEHAFRLAYEHLNIERLLDPEDVNVDHPDKKSVMMYVMCYFQALPHTDIVIDNGMESPVPSPRTPRAKIELPDSTVEQSKPTTSVSSASSRRSTNSSVDLNSYQESLEGVLTWLLEAEESLHKQGDIASEVQRVKEQFHQHEEFMVDLTKHQSSVGNVLQEGNQLIAEGKVTEDEENEIRVQMGLLNNRWEDLRVKAMDRQSRLQQVLMSLQQIQLDSLASWLSKMEERIETQPMLGSDLDTIMSQIDQHKSMQEELEREQQQVNNLQNMVVVVDENNSDTAYADLEQQLETLGQRWANVCKWVEDHWLLLQKVLILWQSFSEEQRQFGDWLVQKEEVLAHMRLVDLNDASEVIAQVKKLKSIEQDMDVQVQRFDDLNERGQEIVQYMDGNMEAITMINNQLEEFQERWDSLVQQMEYQSKEIASSGIDLTMLRNPAHAQLTTVTRPDGSQTVTETVVTTVSKSTVYSTGAKRPRIESSHRREFDTEVGSFTEWLDKTEINLELLTTEPADPKDTLTLEEQMVLIKDTESDVKRHLNQLQRLQGVGNTLMEEQRLEGESVELVQHTLSTLERRWKDINLLLEDTQHKVTMNLDQHTFFSELNGLQDIMTTYEKWVNTAEKIAEEATEISRQLEQCRVKLKAMKSYEEKVEKLNQDARVLAKLPESPDSLTDQITEFNRRWESTYEKIGERQQLLSEALERAPPKTYLDAMDAMIRWITGVEILLQSEMVLVSEEAAMEEQAVQYKALQQDLQDHLSSLEYLNRTGQDLVDRAPSPDKAGKLRLDLADLNSRWGDISVSIEERLERLEKAIAALRQYKNQVAGLVRWMEEMDVFLHAEEAALGDIETLRAQLRESDGVQEDIATLQQNVVNINELSKQLLQTAEDDFSTQISAEINDLYLRWEEVIKVSQDQNKRLREALAKSQAVIDRISVIVTWIDEFTKDKMKEEYDVKSANDLDAICKKLQELKMQVSSKSAEVADLNTEVTEIKQKAAATSLDELTASNTTLQQKWADLQNKIDNLHTKYSKASVHWVDFRVAIDAENRWLEQAEELLRGTPKSSVDAEEISEELDELETFMRKRRSNKAQAEQIGKSLIDSGVLAGTVKWELDKLQQRSDHVETEAHQKSEQLENSIQQAQSRESQMIEMSQWMTEVVSLLHSRLDADILAGDMPQEYETLKTEFSQQEAFLEELKKQADDFKAQGKTDAGERLEQQLTILQKHYTEVMVMFKRFQRPVDFEPKMGHVKRELDEIADRIHLIDLHTEDPEVVQTQLDHCMKFYQTMSEIKTDVEYVIKTGRQVVERKQVNFPDRLNQQIDHLKMEYNELGRQVTTGKNSLERALKLAKKLKKERVAVSDWLQTISAELTRRESVQAPPNIDEEMAWIQTVQAEMTKREPVLTTMEETLNQLKELAEEGTLNDAERTNKQVADQWSNLAARLPVRISHLQEQISRLEVVFTEFQTSLKDVNQWVTKAERMLKASVEISVEDQASSAEVDGYKVLQQELTDLRSRVDEVRDSAVDLMNKSERYHSMVEPELTNLNQRWQEVSDQIKERQTLQNEAIIGMKTTNLNASPVLERSEATTTRSEVATRTEVTTRTEFTTSSQFTSRSEVDGDIDSQLDRAVNAVDLFSSNLLDGRALREEDFTVNVEEKVKETDSEIEKLQQEILFILENGDQVIHETEVNDPEKAARIKERMENLKVQWNTVLVETESKKTSLKTIVPEWHQYQRQTDSLAHVFDDIEAQLQQAQGDSNKLKAVEDEIAKRESDVDEFNQQADDLRDKGADSVVEPTQVKLNKRWHEIRGQFAQYNRPPECPPPPEYHRASPDSHQVTLPVTQHANTDQMTESRMAAAESEVVITKRTVTTVSTSHSEIMSSMAPSQMVEDILRVLHVIADVYDHLRSSVLSGRQYEEFSSQEDKLKAIKETLDTIQPSVEAIKKKKVPTATLR